MLDQKRNGLLGKPIRLILLEKKANDELCIATLEGHDTCTSQCAPGASFLLF